MSRPKGETQTRNNLIDAAKDCFTQLGYERVSTRQIARRAGVDAAMIRYYFGSKAGLFEAMVLETIEPVLQTLQKRHDLLKTNDPLTIMQTYYRVMSANPDLPRLMLRVMYHGDSDEAFNIMSSIFNHILMHIRQWFSPDNPHWSFNNNIEPELAQFSMISLMVFPLIAPKYLIQEFGIETNELFLNQLASHNHQVMLEGLFQFKEPGNRE
ncbi:TetR/AcrR family transcriptional regulator [Vibrio salinus]|uniref:TetR/AcrR family transcriptional regulator n=1 Tax=Vibrio salinus TaxID=2899784 RepID=UPI001E3C5A6A|nr:TetR/AcrR family transcriptional regulator [Vibrio salinus]MCE0493724.1 TetR/AcrR family transcriptional regulator [Vibrio salinus]